MKKLSLRPYDIQQLSYESLWKECGDVSVKEVHYCSICDSMFPADRNQYICATENCEGLRYKGTAQA